MTSSGDGVEMELGVELELGNKEPDGLQWPGRVWCYSYGLDRFRYREQLRTWASSKNWEVGSDIEGLFSIS